MGGGKTKVVSALRVFDKFAKLLDVSWGSIADGQFLKRSGSNVTGVASELPYANWPVGSVIQVQHAEQWAEIFSNTQEVLPIDINSGIEVLSCSITPRISNSDVRVRASGMVSGYATSGLYNTSELVMLAGSVFIGATYVGHYTDNLPRSWLLDITHAPGAGTTLYSLRLASLLIVPIGVNAYANGNGYVSAGYKPVTSLTLMEIKR